MLISVAPIEPLGWKVFVEQPVAEVYAKLNASIVRTALLLLAGLADLGARRAGARARHGAADPDARRKAPSASAPASSTSGSTCDTGDELQALAEQFNRMSAQLRESYAGLERKVDERTRELTSSLEQQTAISEILRVISGSPTDVQPVLDAIAERAARLCDASAASIYLTDGDRLRHVASQGSLPDPSANVETLPVDRTSMSGRALLERQDDPCPTTCRPKAPSIR